MLLLSRWSWRKHKTFVRGAKISDLRVSLGKARGEAGLSHPPPTPWWGGAGGFPSHRAGISVAGLFFCTLGTLSRSFISSSRTLSWANSSFSFVFPSLLSLLCLFGSVELPVSFWSTSFRPEVADTACHRLIQQRPIVLVLFSSLRSFLLSFSFSIFFLLITQLLAWLSCDRRSFGIFDGYIRR